MPVILSKIASKYNVAKVAMEHALSFLSVKDQAVIRGRHVTGSLLAHFAKSDYLELVVWAVGAQPCWRPRDDALALCAGRGTNRVLRWALHSGFIDSALDRAARIAAENADVNAYAMLKARSEHLIENPWLLPLQHATRNRFTFWPNMNVVATDMPVVLWRAARSGCVAILKMNKTAIVCRELRIMVENALLRNQKTVLEYLVARFGVQKVAEQVRATSWVGLGSVTPDTLAYLLEAKLIHKDGGLPVMLCMAGNVAAYTWLTECRASAIEEQHVSCAVRAGHLPLVRYMHAHGAVFTSAHFEEAVYKRNAALVLFLAELGCVPHNADLRAYLLSISGGEDTEDEEEDELTARMLKAVFARADGITEPRAKKRKLK